jgi:hypothetical protein
MKAAVREREPIEHPGDHDAMSVAPQFCMRAAASYLDWHLYESAPVPGQRRHLRFVLHPSQGRRRYQIELDTAQRRPTSNRDVRSLARRHPQIYVWLVCELAELTPEASTGHDNAARQMDLFDADSV